MLNFSRILKHIFPDVNTKLSIRQRNEMYMGGRRNNIKKHYALDLSRTYTEVLTKRPPAYLVAREGGSI